MFISRLKNKNQLENTDNIIIFFKFDNTRSIYYVKFAMLSI